MTSSLWRQPPILPQALKPNDLARIVHLAGAVAESAVLAGRALLHERGMATLYDPNANAPDHYLAATDAQRQRDFERGIDDERVRALLCARGGYGTMRLLDSLAPIAAPERFPWLVGYSDITALHLWANAQGVATIHGPLVSGLARYGDDSEELTHLLTMLRQREALGFGGLRTLHGGRASGRLIGGNLSLLQAMIGTPWLPHLDGALLLIEEVGEPAYRIDRMLQSLQLGGRSHGLQGIIFGELSDCRGLDERMTPEWLRTWSSAFSCPVVMGLPVGHGPRNIPIMLGMDYTLDADHGTLTPETPQRSAPTAVSTSVARLKIPPAEAPMGAGYFPAQSHAPSRLISTLTEMLNQGACSGLQLVVSQHGQRTHSISMGCTAALPDAAIATVTPTTRFDLASVSKALSTAILCHQLIDAGELSLNDRIPPAISVSGATLSELLSHRSGLPAWERLYDEARMQAAPSHWLRQRFQQLERVRPANQQCVYSDPGYILLGWWLEAHTGQTLAQLFGERIAKPLELQHTGYRISPPESHERGQFAATEWCGWRSATLQGVVHDEHAQILGGVAGHAGLFGTAIDVDRLANSLLGFGEKVLSAQAVERMWSRPSGLCEGAYTLGWDTPSTVPSNAGSLMRAESTVGHLGYAGTSLWIDHAQKIAVTLLTNRVHPTRDAQGIRRFRPILHDLVLRELL